ncbi:MAG: hypothetical protein ACTSYA_08450, partial [Candidatus Kariarchaeaceae archaeon]
ILEGELIVLKTGMKIEKALEIKTVPEEGLTLLPGAEEELVFQVTNKSHEEIVGKVSILCSEELCKTQITEITLKPNEFCGIPIKAIVPETDLGNRIVDIKVVSEFQVGGSAKVLSKIETFPLRIINGGVITYIWDETKLITENDNIRVRLNLEGGNYGISSKEESTFGSDTIRSGYRIGPPFDLSEFAEKRFDYEIHSTKNETKIVLSCPSEDRAGLIFKQEITVRANADMVKCRAGFLNTLTDNTHEVGVRFGYNHNMPSPLEKLYIPLKEGVIECPYLGVPSHDHDFPVNPEEWDEQWTVRTSRNNYLGVFWEKERVSRISASSVEYKLPKIEPGNTEWTSSVWIVKGKGSWKEAIQNHNYYNLKLAKTIINQKSYTVLPLVEISSSWNDLKIIEAVDQEVVVKLVGVNRRNTPQMGTAQIVLPKGWKTKDGESEVEFQIEGLIHANNWEEEIIVIPPVDLKEGLSISYGKIIFKERIGNSEFPLLIPIAFEPITSEVTLVEETLEEKKVITLSNGSLTISSSPDFGGCLFKLLSSDGVNHIKSSFPNVVPSVLGPYSLGGIRAYNMVDDDDLSHNKEHLDEFSWKPYEEKEWKGIEYTSIGKEHKSTFGLQKMVSYSLKPGLPIVKITRKFINPTGVPVRLVNILNLVPGVEGSTAKNWLSFVFGDQLLNLNREQKMVFAFTDAEKSALIVTHEETERGLALVNIGKNSNLMVGDIGEMFFEALGGHSVEVDSEEVEVTSYVAFGRFEGKDIYILKKLLENAC